MKYLLVDNGSLRPESVLNLRRVARKLSEETGQEVLPASLLHSSKVPEDQLEGEPAVNFERRLRWSLEAGEDAFTVIPFFFGPSAAITDYMPRRLAYRRQKHGDFAVWRVPFLWVEDGSGANDDLLKILADHVRQVIAETGWRQPKVALVDHGSPLPEVAAVRDAIAGELRSTLGDAVEAVSPASMERREGEAYAFNEPLLENLLDRPGWNTGPVIIAMLFLSPGRHAGTGGDVATICRDAESRHPDLRTRMTALVGEHPGIIPLLKQRMAMERVAL